MTKFSVWLILFVITPLLAAGTNDDFLKNVPDPAARFANGIIFRRQLSKLLLSEHPAEYYRKLAPETLDFEIRRGLDALIARRLLENQFQEAGITATSAEVVVRLQELYRRLTPSQRKMLDNNLKLRNQTLTAYTEETAQDSETIFRLKLRKLIELRYPGKFDIDAATCEEYYRNHQDRFHTPEAVDLSRIYFDAKKPPNGSPEQIQKADAQAAKRAETVYALLKKGLAFEFAAARFSDCPSRTEGGHIGTFIRRSGLEKNEEQIAFELPEGSVSEIIPLTTGYEIIRVNRHSPEGYSPLAEVKPLIVEELQNERLDQLATRLLSKTRHQAKVVILYQSPAPAGKTEAAP